MRRAFTLGTIFCLAGLLSQPPSTDAFQDEGTLRVGGMWALSGGVALTNKGALALTNLAIEEINAASEIGRASCRERVYVLV